jgi:hypothetical protein
VPLQHRLAALWRNLTQEDRVERELDDEVRATFDMLVVRHGAFIVAQPPTSQR